MEAQGAAPAGAPLAAPPATVAARRWYWWLVVVSVIGSLDIAQFLATNSGMFRSAPGRAAGSVLGLIVWLALTAIAGLAASGPSVALRTAEPTSASAARGSSCVERK